MKRNGYIHTAEDARDDMALVTNGGKLILLYGLLGLVLRARHRIDKNEHTQMQYQAVRNPQKRKRSSLSLRNKKSE